MWHRIRIVVLLLLIVALMPKGAYSQSNTRYFPETGYSVGGRFLEYWQSHGGLAVFGFPISAELNENGRTVQYFERQRFELHPENRRPYDVLLGLLGAERLSSGGAPPPASNPVQGCEYFPTTRHNVCNQQGSIGFLSYWRSHGLEFDGRAGKSYQESLALLGYPLTEAYEYTNTSGQVVLAQWFERARFEWHPNNPNAYKVLLGRLGAEIHPWTPGPGPEPGPPQFTQVQIFLISTGEGSVGCGDAIVPVTRQIAPTTAPLRAALTELLSIKTPMLGESGLYNALYQSDLSIERLVIENGRAIVDLKGTIRLGGVCDEPRVVAQLEQTVRQFPTVSSVTITVNGEPLADAIR